MRHVEYPDDVTFLEYTKVPDGAGGFSRTWLPTISFRGFLDTPSSREIYTAQQLTNPYDRNLYYPYRTDVGAKMRCSCNGDTYELVGRPQDQGGLREVMKVPLKLVPHGT